eukprot:6030785-Amphidinium_carterae.1
MIRHARSGKSFSCVDADAWDEQHSYSAIANKVDEVVALCCEQRPKLRAQFEELGHHVKRLEASKAAIIDGQGTKVTLQHTLFSGDPLTALLKSDN